MKLYLASSSPTRQALLREAGIDFEIISQNANERSISWDAPLDVLVVQIAELKMAHIVIPSSLETEGTTAYFLTADTLSQDYEGKIIGKPHDMQEAYEQVKRAAFGSYVATGFCLEKKRFEHNRWHTIERETGVVGGNCHLIIPENMIARYLERTAGCGSIMIDGFGFRFLKDIQGSYTAILGLPLYEICLAFDRMQ